MRLKLIDIFPQWRLYLMAGAALLVVGFYFYLTHLQHIARAQKQQLAQAARKADIAIATTKALDQVATKTQSAERKANAAVRVIHEAPGADTPLPGPVLDAWKRGLRDGDAEPAY